MAKRQKTKEESQRVKEKSSISQEEANSLERMIEKNIKKIDSPELKIILNEQRIQNEQKMQKSSPSLEKVNAPQRIPTRLEGNLAENTAPIENSNGEDSFKYNIGERKLEKPKYTKYEGKIIENIIPHGEIQNLGKGNVFERREIGFESSPQTRNSGQENFEKYSPVKKVDKDKLGKESPFERREIKYTPEKY